MIGVGDEEPSARREHIVMRARWLGVVGVLLLTGLRAGGAERRPPSRSTDGSLLHRTECAPCHGTTGRGDGPDASSFSPPPRDLRSGFLDRYDTADLVRRVLDSAPLALALDVDAARKQAGDVEALVAHLERLPRIDWSLVDRGEEIWLDRCESCHGPFGRPGPTVPPGMERPRDFSAPTFQRAYGDAELLTAVRHRRKGIPAIPALASDADVRALVAFVRLLSPGYETYDRYCASCHGDDGRGADVSASGLSRPAALFDQRYFATHDDEYVRVRVWHMLADQKPRMPHFRGRLTEPQVRAVVEYLESMR
jgi:mono/diheme cytochrome c family protein